MRLTLLAPKVVEGIVEGQITPRLADMMDEIPTEWVRKMG